VTTSTFTFHVNNHISAAAVASTGTFGSTGKLGVGGLSPDGTQAFWPGTWQELIVVKRDTTAAERALVDAWFKRNADFILVAEGDSLFERVNTPPYLSLANTTKIPLLQNIALGGSRLKTNLPDAAYYGDLVYRTAYTDGALPD
jgi:hypothetical protein